MATVNASATFNGAGAAFGLFSMTITQFRAVGAFFQGAGALNSKAVQRMLSGPAVFRGVGILDTWQLSNFWNQAYDPQNPRGDNMQLRKARLSQEGILGDD
jgi:hypothetical protein